jgi:hypothetical protein
MAGNGDEEIQTKHREHRNIPEKPKTSEYKERQYEVTADGWMTVSNEKKDEQSWYRHHISGYSEYVYPDGTYVKTTPAETKVEYGSQSITVRHNQDVNVVGHSKQQIEGGMHMEVAGDWALTVGESGTVNIMGDAAIAVDGNALIMAKGNMNLDAQGDFNVRSKGSTTIAADGGLNLDSKGTMNMQASKIELNNSDGAPGQGWPRTRSG